MRDVFQIDGRTYEFQIEVFARNRYVIADCFEVTGNEAVVPMFEIEFRESGAVLIPRNEEISINIMMEFFARIQRGGESVYDGFL